MGVRRWEAERGNMRGGNIIARSPAIKNIYLQPHRVSQHHWSLNPHILLTDQPASESGVSCVAGWVTTDNEQDYDGSRATDDGVVVAGCPQWCCWCVGLEL